jgi:hypothetical protein
MAASKDVNRRVLLSLACDLLSFAIIARRHFLRTPKLDFIHSGTRNRRRGVRCNVAPTAHSPPSGVLTLQRNVNYLERAAQYFVVSHLRYNMEKRPA